MKIPQRKRKVTTITLDPEIVEKAKKYNLNISRLSEDSLKETIRKLEHETELMGAPKVKKGGEKEMTSKLPWAAAVIIIVAAAGLGAWALWPTEVTPVVSGPSWGYILGENASAGNSGIVAMYIAKANIDNSTDPATWTYPDNYYNKITAQGTMNIPYEENFYIVVEARGVKPYIAYTTRENIKVELGLTGDVSLAAENKTGTQFSWYTTEGTDNIRVSAVWGPYKLSAGGSLNYTAKVWLWA
jgi:hypothetical protein